MIINSCNVPARELAAHRNPRPKSTDRLKNLQFPLAKCVNQPVDTSTVYCYSVSGDEIVRAFRGSKIESGNLYGHATADDAIDLLYHCTTTDGGDLAGWSRGTVKIAQEGNTILIMAWG